MGIRLTDSEPSSARSPAAGVATPNVPASLPRAGIASAAPAYLTVLDASVRFERGVTHLRSGLSIRTTEPLAPDTLWRIDAVFDAQTAQWKAQSCAPITALTSAKSANATANTGTKPSLPGLSKPSFKAPSAQVAVPSTAKPPASAPVQASSPGRAFRFGTPPAPSASRSSAAAGSTRVPVQSVQHIPSGVDSVELDEDIPF